VLGCLAVIVLALLFERRVGGAAARQERTPA
jgi:hypothetical protein